MIVSKISDGLGNQLFMYAAGFATAERLNSKLILDASVLDNHQERKFELNNFNIKYYKLISYKKYKFKCLKVLLRTIKNLHLQAKYRVFNEQYTFVYDKSILDVSDNTYLSGYWQSEKYFKEYREDIISMITPKETRDLSVLGYFEDCSKNNTVSIHVRRGDYLSIGCNISEDYYFKALDLLKSKVKGRLRCYVFSDDIDFCKKMFQESDNDMDFIYPEYFSDNPTIDDLLIMSKCKHNIIANSSYSWWGAWLNNNPEKIVICPETKAWNGDFYPEEWIKIKV